MRATTIRNDEVAMPAADAQAPPSPCNSYNVSVPIPTTLPLAPHTFAGQVEHALCQNFNAADIENVLTSWRLLDRDYEHRAFVGPRDVDPATSHQHQHCHSYVPGLSVKPWWDTTDMKWASYLESKYNVILDEFQAVMAQPAERLQQQGNNIWAGALTADASSYGVGWKMLVLMNRGRWDATNVQLFPQISQIVLDSGVPAVEVFFASMEARSNIAWHSDFTNFVLTSHLALDIPDSGDNKCRLTVGDETRQWINGCVTLFDTSVLHAAVNEADRTRYILMLRLWHPSLTNVERQALQFTYDCLDAPALLSDNASERAQAERWVQAWRDFPELSSTRGSSSSRTSGFGNNKATERPGKKSKKRAKRK